MTGPDSRIALYYASLPEDPLYALGPTATLSQPQLPDIVSLIAEPRVYWFHATWTAHAPG